MSSFKDGSSFSDLNKLAKGTGGKAVSVESTDSDYLDDLVFELAGGAEGSLGYGSAEFTYDLGKVVALNDITVFFSLAPNTTGEWSVSLSKDNYGFDHVSGFFEPSQEIDFSGFHTRYLKFNFELTSGLSLTNESGYETVPTTGVPKVESISITYTEIRNDYIYFNPQDVTGDVHQVTIAVNSNKDIAEGDLVKVGASLESSNTWDDYDTIHKPERNDNEKVVFLDRFNTQSNSTNNEFVDLLQSVDGYLFKATYGPWNPEQEMTVYKKTTVSNGTTFYNEIVSSDDYTLIPRKGYVLFKTRKLDDFCLVSSSSTEFRVGVKVVNDGTNTVEITGLGYMYSEREHE